MTNKFLPAYLEKLSILTETFASGLHDYAAQAALKTLQENWKAASFDAACAEGKGSPAPGLFGVAAMQEDLQRVIEMLEHFKDNLEECTRVSELGEDVATPDRVISVLQQRLHLIPAAKPAVDQAGEVVVFGSFYEMPDGVIAKTTGAVNTYGVVKFYLDDGADSLRVISFDDFRAWKHRRDLRDFPNARDPMLPYEFDLHWDIKYTSELWPYLDSCCDSKVEAALRAAMDKHGIKDPGATGG